MNTEHGGSDSGPAAAFDFSSNASPLGAPPLLLQAVLTADRSRYPDPSYAALRAHLAVAEEVGTHRVLPASGGAEAIRRLSLAARLSGLSEVWVPQPGFGDYAAAASALGLQVHRYADVQALSQALRTPALVWVCEPCNPTGDSLKAADWLALDAALQRSGALLAIDCAYEPLRLDGNDCLPQAMAEQAWRLVCPNKALALTGVRAAYLLAPASGRLSPEVAGLAASWVLSSEGLSLLMHWHSDATLSHLRQAKAQLLTWRADQREMLAALGWQQRPTCTNFWLAKPGQAGLLGPLRERGIKLRDATSFGLPGWVRLSTQMPEAQHALQYALKELQT
ncbi:aminotransferase class I/II-fold pyridoxal phosphate-dependent enzyme [Paucibacter sp. TC2R-5]|uniref:aminotransferase class I/II-fold pyridoxal phosphate-dependent enzyme n=1 Tax=Paucibacter sp. TC2R-5 TaxID=2893555 RepID=UPI0021E40FC7|nr:aminotransferase class I/II-fold pyridoxal phosphate-dependent enzyme [Paucibacter sp. TC2R-5]MCV2359602.1 aminotransferase class I/II-fold pyridoxal phosphate-dependent enzyme [Paucibacter sp. TC2R-5]